MSVSRFSSALLLVIVACGTDSPDALVAPGKTFLLIPGPTDSVEVRCPPNLVDGQSVHCNAEGFDANGMTTTTDATWSNLTPSLLILDDLQDGANITAKHMVQGDAIVSATIEGVVGYDTVAISLSDLDIAIFGEEEIPPSTPCMWWSSVSDGTAPYSYFWHRTGSLDTSTQSSFTTQGSTSFTVYLKVTDLRGTERFAEFPVTVDSQAPLCPSF